MDEIFWFSVAPNTLLLKKGEEIGGLLMFGRATTDGKNLTSKMKTWIKRLTKIGSDEE